MYTFPELLKKIREEGNLTQEDLAVALSVSTVLIAMIESKQKDVSKGFIIKLADKLDVHPSSITPFLFSDDSYKIKDVSGIEKSLIRVGEKLQNYLIKNKAKKLKQYVPGK
jgi:transcriptional regulator with XRE-family HTH domain